MSVLIKRSVNGSGVAECSYRCCTPIYGKNVKHVRRMFKSKEKATFRKLTKTPDVW